MWPPHHLWRVAACLFLQSAKNASAFDDVAVDRNSRCRSWFVVNCWGGGGECISNCILRIESLYWCLYLVASLVLSRLDYCNGVFTGLPSAVLGHLQAVMNMVAGHEHGRPPSLRRSSWIEFKLSVLVYMCLHDMAHYLARHIIPTST
jgi:hypothetical protein